MDNAARTVDLFLNGRICSQAVLTVFGEPYGLDSELAQKLGRPLGGGMGRLGRTCGAVTAAILILGLAKDHADKNEAKRIAFASVQEFVRRFEALHGTVECKNLLGADVSTKEGLKQIQEEKLFATVCPNFVGDAANILDELLAI
ncbi:C-GCAxxG-C-C family protein [Desulfomonile tiedjei]|uniref:C_GCAxxG_C_C family probable redox protein n=1 Tax=Desulfomonile tiedjei (strain ATCC 49306 / DSM 6799 / DCB-1) TaxID=706587 RepID=I4C297_DESTA|nr:C-GCAxxG-C-C family protein [Desulfomonile tiedjei]AFM23688.1 C_GCAxxG_C_C family probable redox protein [Desulfomonile tiedjei DSM 6799]